MREAGFKNSYIFKYSPRPGTKGHELLADDIPEEVKKRRNNDLLAIQNAASLQGHLQFIGQRVEVLVEGPSKNAFKEEDGTAGLQMTGRSRTDHIVVFPGQERLAGQMVAVDIHEASTFTLFGTIATTQQVGVDVEAAMGEDRPHNLPARTFEEGKSDNGRFSLPLV